MALKQVSEGLGQACLFQNCISRMARFHAVIERHEYLSLRVRPDFMIALALTKQLETSTAQNAFQLRTYFTHAGSGSLNDI